MNKAGGVQTPTDGVDPRSPPTPTTNGCVFHAMPNWLGAFLSICSSWYWWRCCLMVLWQGCHRKWAFYVGFDTKSLLLSPVCASSSFGCQNTVFRLVFIYNLSLQTDLSCFWHSIRCLFLSRARPIRRCSPVRVHCAISQAPLALIHRIYLGFDEVSKALCLHIATWTWTGPVRSLASTKAVAWPGTDLCCIALPSLS